MPYKSMKEVNPSIKGIKPPVTLAQANLIAECADSVEGVESPWAVCITQFKKKTHEIEDGRWIKKEARAQQMGELIPLADFTEAGDTISVQVARTGRFTEKHGREVEITEADLDTYVVNFEAGVAGQQVPIFQGHPSVAIRPEKPATAWYKRLYTKLIDVLNDPPLDVVKRHTQPDGLTDWAAVWAIVPKTYRKVKTLWADIELSDLGRDLIAKKLYKYFSPTIDLENKVVKGGGFVNLPAIKGMAAMELSQFLQEAKPMSLLKQVKQALRELFTLEPGFLADFSQHNTERAGGDDEMTDEERIALEAKIRADIEAEFAERAQTVADLTESITTEVRVQVEAEFTEKAKRVADLSEFVTELSEAGLSTPPDEVTAALMLLNEEQLAAVKPVLKAKMVDFTERGHDGTGVKVKQLPEAMKAALERHCKSSQKPMAEAVAQFCKANNLDVAEYDLSEFLPAE